MVRFPVATLVAIAVWPLGTPASAREDTQLWTSAAATVKLGQKWRLSQEVTARFSDDRNGLYEIESNTLLGYRLSDKMTIWAGYTHSPNYAGGDFTVMEHRAREQVTIDKLAKIGAGTLSGRLRLEQRWREGLAGTGWRLRPYAKYSLPLNEGGRTALVLSHESYVNLNRTIFQQVEGYERMRNLIAISTPLANNVTAEIGYLNQHGFVPSADDSSDHVLSLAVSASF